MHMHMHLQSSRVAVGSESDILESRDIEHHENTQSPPSIRSSVKYINDVDGKLLACLHRYRYLGDNRVGSGSGYCDDHMHGSDTDTDSSSCNSCVDEVHTWLKVHATASALISASSTSLHLSAATATSRTAAQTHTRYEKRKRGGRRGPRPNMNAQIQVPTTLPEEKCEQEHVHLEHVEHVHAGRAIKRSNAKSSKSTKSSKWSKIRIHRLVPLE